MNRHDEIFVVPQYMHVEGYDVGVELIFLTKSEEGKIFSDTM